nr:type II secretion system minor pseudopilin GspK [Ramlibacter paludis]
MLAAMLTVSLVATFAAAALWQQWRAVEIEAAERTRVQSAWILTGALDWSRLILREDRRSSGVDHLGEPWAVPLQEARLSTFLAADTSNNADTEGADAVFLSGDITDLQSLLNVQNLFKASSIDPQGLQSFQRLFEVLGLPQSELGRLAENFRFASDISVDNRNASKAPLVPGRVEQLVWLGLSPATVAALKPYVTLLPASTTVNLNTAPPEVIYAALRGISLADAQRLVAVRASQPFRKVEDALEQLPASTTGKENVGYATNFFEVRGRIRLNEVLVEERSIVQRSPGGEVKAIQRERGVLDPAALAQLSQRR